MGQTPFSDDKCDIWVRNSNDLGLFPMNIPGEYDIIPPVEKSPEKFPEKSPETSKAAGKSKAKPSGRREAAE